MMAPRMRLGVLGLPCLAMLWLGLSGCGASTDTAAPAPRSLAERAARRAYSGAPPVIPHPPLSGTCASCHTPEGGRSVPGVGVAPGNPHTQTPGMSAQSRCKQCHAFQIARDVFQETEFVGLAADGRRGERAHAEAPPLSPHPLFMHEDCRACHTGAGARSEILCRHAERDRCQQCHISQQPGAPSPRLAPAPGEVALSD